MLSFHNDRSVKEKYLSRLRAHAKADEFLKGQYWENGKGCAVGCTIHSNQHKRYETELGLPEWLARLEDRIFEGLPNAAAKTFPVQFLEAIPIGVDLTPLKWQFCAFVLRENIEQVLALKIDATLKVEVVSAVQKALAVHEEAIKTGKFADAAWSAASAAESAAWSAASAAWSASASAAASAASAAASAAESVASAAASVASATRSAAWSAESAAWSAASAAESVASATRRTGQTMSAAYERYANKLINLLGAA